MLEGGGGVPVAVWARQQHSTWWAVVSRPDSGGAPPPLAQNQQPYWPKWWGQLPRKEQTPNHNERCAGQGGWWSGCLGGPSCRRAYLSFNVLIHFWRWYPLMATVNKASETKQSLAIRYTVFWNADNTKSITQFLKNVTGFWIIQHSVLPV